MYKKMIFSFMIGTALTLVSPASMMPGSPTAAAATSSALITAKPATAQVYVDGKAIAIQGYNINGNNYFKLRDLAYALKGTSRQFAVDWSAAGNTIQLQSGKPYLAIGGELASGPAVAATAIVSRSEVLIANQKAALTAYTIKGSNYFMLRELGERLQFPVLWRPGDRSIRIVTDSNVQVEQYSDLWTELSTNDYYYGNWRDLSQRYMFQSGGQTYILEDSDSERQDESAAGKNGTLQVYTVAEPQAGRKFTIRKELPLFGGFHAGEDGNYYVVYGQSNMEESQTKAVYRIVKYDSKWNKLAHADITDVYTTRPFDAGNLSMDSDNGRLIIHSTRQRYLTEDDGLRHQSNITFILDMKSMDVIRNGEQWPSNHVSHSFAAYVRFDGDRIVYADHGDAYPRSHLLQIEELDTKQVYEQMFAPVLGGVTGDNYTGIYLGGLEVGSANYMALSTYSKLYRGPVNSQNVRLDYVTKDYKYDPYTATIWLTDYAAEDNVAINQSHLMKIDEHTFVAMWEERMMGEQATEAALYYAIVSDTGALLQKPVRLAGIPAPGNMDPIVDGGRTVKWYYAKAADWSEADPVEVYALTIPSFSEQELAEGPAIRPASARSFPRIKQTLERLGYNMVLMEEGGSNRQADINDSSGEYYFTYAYYNDQESKFDGVRGKFQHVFADNTVDMAQQLTLAQQIIEADLDVSLPGFVEQVTALIGSNSPLIVDQTTMLEYSLTINGVTLDIMHYGYPPYYESVNFTYKN